MTKHLTTLSLTIGIALCTAGCAISASPTASKAVDIKLAATNQSASPAVPALSVTPTIAAEKVEKRGKILFEKGATVAFTGNIEKRSNTGLLLQRYSVVQGLAQGVWVEWFEQGGIRFYGEWKDGKGDGVFIYFHENGEISERVQVRNDLWHGVAEGWHANGNKAFESRFVDGKRVAHQKFENPKAAAP